jgi:hypothetical protein
MDLGSILLGAALLIVVAFIVARPLLDRAGARDRAPGPAEALLFERERLLTALRDLDFDHATGKLVEEDYSAQRAQLVAQGAEVLRQLDALGPAPDGDARPRVDHDSEIEQAIARRRARPAAVTAPAKASAAASPTAAPSAAVAVDQAIEAEVARRRQKPRFCSQCGQPLQPDDKFCGACGAKVSHN